MIDITPIFDSFYLGIGFVAILLVGLIIFSQIEIVARNPEHDHHRRS